MGVVSLFQAGCFLNLYVCEEGRRGLIELCRWFLKFKNFKFMTGNKQCMLHNVPAVFIGAVYLSVPVLRCRLLPLSKPGLTVLGGRAAWREA